MVVVVNGFAILTKVRFHAVTAGAELFGIGHLQGSNGTRPRQDARQETGQQKKPGTKKCRRRPEPIQILRMILRLFSVIFGASGRQRDEMGDDGTNTFSTSVGISACGT